jgi:hypothetical protein
MCVRAYVPAEQRMRVDTKLVYSYSAEFTEPFNQGQRDLYSYVDCIMWSRLENSY